jgi:YgiT-type zinc finger domain-containing protein
VDERFQEPQIMICLICRHAKMVEGMTSIIFERGKIQFGVSNVPAYICTSCGDAYVEADVAVKLLRDAEEISRAGIRDVIREFELGS